MSHATKIATLVLGLTLTGCSLLLPNAADLRRVADDVQDAVRHTAADATAPLVSAAGDVAAALQATAAAAAAAPDGLPWSDVLKMGGAALLSGVIIRRRGVAPA